MPFSMAALSLILRTVTYASLFVAVLLVYLPARLLDRSEVTRSSPNAAQDAGVALATLGAMLAVWCIASFAITGRGTPFPLDPPRRLVTRGPYRFVRNPMYLGAILALSGAAAWFRSWPVLLYAAFFFAASHAFVIFYEEPTLRKMFGDDYQAYCKHVARWLPRIST